MRSIAHGLIMAAARSSGFATGGTVTIITDGGTNYRVHTFTSSGTLLVYGSLTAEYLIVGGGGAPGESWSTGGGGGGGVLYTSAGSGISVTAGSYSIVVGAGGTANDNALNDGGDSSALGLTAIGGGGGGAFNANGNSGGSGGGGGSASGSNTVGGAGTAGQGSSGGSGKAVAVLISAAAVVAAVALERLLLDQRPALVVLVC